MYQINIQDALEGFQMYRSINIVLLLISFVIFSIQTMANPISDVPYDQDPLQQCIERVDPANPSPLTYTDRLMIVADCIQQVQNDQNWLQQCITRIDPVNPSPLTRTDRLMIVADCIQQVKNDQKNHTE